MNKKGFTLIELLAVIVILAVIALITTPMVLTAISTANSGAAKDAAYGFVQGVEFSIMQGMTNGTASPTHVNTTANVPVKGSKPTAVSLNITAGEVTGGTMTINGIVATVGAGGVITVP